MENQLKSGDILYSKYSGKVEVTAIKANGFYIRSNGIEHFREFSDLGKVLFEQDILKNKSQQLGKDEILIEEKEYLCHTKNVIYRKINDYKDRVSTVKRDMDWGKNVSKGERQVWLSDRWKVERGVEEADTLKMVESEPYFARMDFEDVANKEIIKAYIGQKAIDEDGEIVVYDWRSPLGQRYNRRNELEFKLAGNKYMTNLIRRFEIKKSLLYRYEDEYDRINGIDDIYVLENTNNISDPFLIKILKSKRNKNNIGNIISSIQNNQNNIITQDINTNIIVQGCAGSGKTMVLLHRLSYLVYNNRNLELNRFKVITPNKLFKMSINNLAKELELDRISMMSIEEYMESKSREYGVNFRYVLNEDYVPEDMYNFIYSEEYLSELKNSYRTYIDSLWVKFKDLEIYRLVNLYEISLDKREMDEGYNHLSLLVSKILSEFQKRSNEYISIKKRTIEIISDEKNSINLMNEDIDKLKELVKLMRRYETLGLLAIRERRSIKSQMKLIMSYVELDDKVNINFIEQLIEDKSKKVSEKNDLIKLLNDRIEEFRKGNFLSYEPEELKSRLYELDILMKEEKTFLEGRIYNALINKISRKFNHKGVINGRIKLFSLLNLLYMHKGRLNKVDRMLCFDEGQDINKYEYKLLNDINGGNVVFNILGDVNQLIDKNKGISDWENLFNIKEFKQFKLEENYRNSQEISEYCINETGYEMRIIGVDDGNVVLAKDADVGFIQLTRNFIRDDGNRKVVIVKKINEDIQRFLATYFDSASFNFIYDDRNFVKTDKLNIITVKMVKGMEFDTTLVITKDMTNNEKYIALTRALVNSYVIS